MPRRRGALSIFKRFYRRWDANALGDCDVFSSYDDRDIKEMAADFDLCKLCTKCMHQRDVGARERVWGMLPEVLGMTECGFTNGDDLLQQSESLASHHRSLFITRST